MQARTLLRNAIFLAAAITLPGSSTGGCESDPASQGAMNLRVRFPDHVTRVLGTGAGFAPMNDGFARREDPGREGALGLHAFLPREGSEALRLQLPDGFEARVRELDVAGEGVIEGSAVAYSRAGGTSFWATTEGGYYEEWLLLEAGTAFGDRAAAVWEIEGGRLAQQGNAVDVVDEAGVPRLHVTAPEAYAVSGRAVSVWLEARGARIELRVDAGGEEVLVDPIWTAAASLPGPRSQHTATLLSGGDVLVTGGYNPGAGFAYSNALRYNTALNSWQPLASIMSNNRALHAATSLSNGKVLVTGGTYGGPAMAGGVRKTADLFDPTTNTFGFVPDMNEARAQHTSTLLKNGKVLVAGGTGNFEVSGLGTFEVYDPSTNTWASSPGMNGIRYDHSATLLSNGRVLVAGGHTGTPNGAYVKTADIYDPSTNAWTLAAPMANARSKHVAVLLQNGKVLVAGGFEGQKYLSSTEIYDPATNTWVTGAPMNVPRGKHLAALLQNGKVLVVGGESTFNLITESSAEVYDPNVNTWTTTVPMNVARQDFTATSLQNGKVLVAGGTDGGSFFATTQLFEPIAPAGNGTACVFASECISGFCVDGVCCDSACNAGACDACSVVAGAPSNGTCALLTGTACNDGDACTNTDTCQAGVCTGGNPVVCTASDACHDVGTCNSATGVCSNPAKPDGSTCDDGNGCTQTDTCQVGTCKGGNPVVCVAQDTCHNAGACNPATGSCSNPLKPNGALCNDGNACTKTDTCLAGVCTGANAMTCIAQDVCHDAGVCNPQTGACDNPAKPDGTPCSDGSACSQTDTCQAGACVGDNPVVCPPPDPCHESGVCNPQTGTCSSAAKPNGSPCDDGNACTKADICQAGSCNGGNPVSCTPLDECHEAGICDLQTGDCSHPAKPDGSPCSGGVCSGGTCMQASSSSSSSSSGAGGSSSSSGAGGMGAGSSGSGAGGAAGAGGSGAPDAGSGEPLVLNDSGCGCSVEGSRPSGALWAAAALGLLAERRRRRGR